MDIYIPCLNVGIEYDGTKWHQDINRDQKKDLACYNNNIQLIRIREPNCPQYNSSCSFIYMKDRSYKTLENICREILLKLGIISPNINFDKDIAEIESLIKHQVISNSLAVLYPNIAKEWNYEKNGVLLPKYISAKSDKRVWWLCSNCGYEWVVSVKVRTSKNCGCPKCGRIKSDMNRRKTDTEFLNELNKVNNNILVVGKYITAQEPILVCCKICGYKWSPTPDNLLHGRGCPKCGRENTRKSHCKMIYCPELDSIFESGTEASFKTGVSYSGIMACISGKQKSAGRHPITKEKLTWKEINRTIQNE